MIHIRIDDPTYLALKSKKVELTKVGAELFKQYVELEEIECSEEVNVIAEMDTIRKQQKALNDRFSLLTVQLTHIRQFS